MFSRSVIRSPVVLASKRALAPSMRHVARSIVTIHEAKNMPVDYNCMPNDILLTMAVMGDQNAQVERLIREVMSKDNIE